MLSGLCLSDKSLRQRKRRQVFALQILRDGFSHILDFGTILLLRLVFAFIRVCE